MKVLKIIYQKYNEPHIIYVVEFRPDKFRKIQINEADILELEPKTILYKKEIGLDMFGKIIEIENYLNNNDIKKVGKIHKE